MARRGRPGSGRDRTDQRIQGLLEVAQTIALIPPCQPRGTGRSDALDPARLHGLEWLHVILAGVTEGMLPPPTTTMAKQLGQR